MKEFSHVLRALLRERNVSIGLLRLANKRKKEWKKSAIDEGSLRIMLKKEDALIRKYEGMVIEYTRAIGILNR